MGASLTALATVVWSDFAEAAPAQELSDEVAAPTPVKLVKLQHAPQVDELLIPLEELPRKRRLNFGSFEGY